MFYGTHTPKLDDKFRLTLPAKYREHLRGGVMIAQGTDRSLAVYRSVDYTAKVAALAPFRFDNEANLGYFRVLTGTAEDTALDSAGRVVISAKHRRYAGLTKDCVVVGLHDYIEIWDTEHWTDYQSGHEENYARGLPAGFGGTTVSAPT